MQVEIFVEVQAVKPHPSGGEMYDAEGEPTWKLQDSVKSDSKEIIAGFLLGVADELDPQRNVNAQQRTVIAMNTNWKIIISGTSRGEIPPPVIAELITKRNGVAGAMLRASARNIDPDNTVMKMPVTRDLRD